MNIQPLLEILSRVSHGHILPHAIESVEGDFHRATIPVTQVDASDRTVNTLRRYAADWIRKEGKDVSVSHAYAKLPNNTMWHYEDKSPSTYIVGTIELTWWPKPASSEFDQLMALQRKNREAARRGEP